MRLQWSIFWVNKYSIRPVFVDSLMSWPLNLNVIRSIKNEILQPWNYINLTYFTNALKLKLLLSISLRKRYAGRDWLIGRGRMEMTVKQIRVLIQGLGQGTGTTKELWQPGPPLSSSIWRLNLVWWRLWKTVSIHLRKRATFVYLQIDEIDIIFQFILFNITFCEMVDIFSYCKI